MGEAPLHLNFNYLCVFRDKNLLTFFASSGPRLRVQGRTFTKHVLLPFSIARWARNLLSLQGLVTSYIPDWNPGQSAGRVTTAEPGSESEGAEWGLAQERGRAARLVRAVTTSI